MMLILRSHKSWYDHPGPVGNQGVKGERLTWKGARYTKNFIVFRYF